MEECLFCKIINGDIPSYKIYEDEYTFAFLDINPNSNGHTLIVPKKHYKDITDIPDDELLHIFNAVKNVKKTLEEKLECDGIILQQNNGYVQEVKHFHMHVKPMYSKKQSVDIKLNKDLINDPKEIYEKLKTDN